jgi:hypothetical protein
MRLNNDISLYIKGEIKLNAVCLLSDSLKLFLYRLSWIANSAKNCQDLFVWTSTGLVDVADILEIMLWLISLILQYFSHRCSWSSRPRWLNAADSEGLICISWSLEIGISIRHCEVQAMTLRFHSKFAGDGGRGASNSTHLATSYHDSRCDNEQCDNGH